MKVEVDKPHVKRCEEVDGNILREEDNTLSQNYRQVIRLILGDVKQRGERMQVSGKVLEIDEAH